MKKLNNEVVKGKNPFKVGDLVKLRPDILKLVHQGSNYESRTWVETLKNLEGKMGKISKMFPTSNNVNVKYETSWISHDQHGRKSKIDTIGIDYDKLVPYSKDPSVEEGVGWVYTKDIKKDPHHTTNKMTGKVNRWTVKYENTNEVDMRELRDLGKMPDDKISMNEIKDVIKELLNEMWIGFEEEGKESHPLNKWLGGDGTEDDLSKQIKYPRGVNVYDKLKEGEKDQNITINIVDKVKNKVKKQVDETMDNPNKNYIIFGRSGPQTVYYCNSSTQGARLVPYSQDIAERFKTLEEVKRKIFELKQKYKGIKNWGYEVVPAEKSEWEKTYTATVKLGPNTISTPTKNTEGEWVVKWMVNGVRDENKTYYTDDKKDALNTYARMVKSAEEENKKLIQP
jgi:hypothetical protein